MSIAVFGSLHLDIVVDAPDRPRRGETVAGHRWAMRPGGKGLNQAVAAARHGAAVAMHGAVGADMFGAQLRAHLRKAGVADRVAGLDGGSGISVAIVDAGGDYGAVIVSGVNLDAVPPDAAALAGVRFLVLQNEVAEAANVAAAQAARQAGCAVVLNAAPARTLPATLASCLDILVVNALEADALGGAEALLSVAPAAVVTLGPDGARLLRRGLPLLDVPGRTVRVASTHGAGDCFVGALVAGLDAGRPVETALEAANAAAAAWVATPPERR